MSLRAFHIIFVAASIALCVFLGVWWMRTNLVAGVLFFVGAVVLAEYGRRVFRKLRELP